MNNKTNKDLAERVNKLTIALLLLVSVLRSRVKVDENNEAVASAPVAVLDTVEKILKNL